MVCIRSVGEASVSRTVFSGRQYAERVSLMGGVPTLDEEDVEEQEVIVDVVSRGATNDRVFPTVDDPTDVTEWSLIISWMDGCVDVICYNIVHALCQSSVLCQSSQ